MEEIQTQAQLTTKSCERDWSKFFQKNCGNLFQIAILLTADPLTAEAALVESADRLPFEWEPEEASVAAWQKTVVMCSIQASERSSSGATPLARLMLQQGLWPVLEIERLPRVCFVLRMLLGYPTDLCAQMLGIEESCIRTLVQMAVIQLQQKSVANRADT